jgi:hypothetical protein
LVAAFAVGLVAIPAAQSTQGQPVIAGQNNTAVDETFVDATGALSIGLEARGGTAGVTGVSASGTGGDGVQGFADDGRGVYGRGNTGSGVFAESFGLSPSLFARNNNTTGGVAIEGLNTAPNWVAIWGHHDPGSFGYGVLGEAPIGVGVLGRGSDSGVKGSTDSASGSGVTAENTAGGTALTVNGKASFSRSGIVTIPAGAKSFTQTGVSLSNTSFVLATSQSNGARWVTSAVPNPAGSSFTINLNKPAPAGGVKVGYLIGN